jgi:indole-3-glycerol phosphate synthase
MNLLSEIVKRKKIEVRERKNLVSLSDVKDFPNYQRERKSLVSALSDPESSGVIAEIKRASPSRGMLFPDLDVVEVAKGYEEAGVAGISILTDFEGFKGSIDDILLARDQVSCPILRKDFMVDPYQIEEARAIGADVVLIIASALEPAEAKELSVCAKELGLEVLLELHEEAEIESHLGAHADIVGINNRNLKTLEINISTSFELVSKIPDQYLRISESGISEPETIMRLQKAGFRGFLIGENFMKTKSPGEVCRNFIRQIKEA